MSDLNRLMDQLDAWDPDAGDLPDEVALGLDTHEALRVAYDARFAATDLGTPSLPDGLADRVMPGDVDDLWLPEPRTRGVWIPIGQVVLATAAVAMVGLLWVGLAGNNLTSTFSSVGEPLGGWDPAYDPRRTHRAPITVGDPPAGRPLPVQTVKTTQEVQTESERPVDLPPGAIGSHVDHGVSGFVGVRHDPLSTFAVDVDTASYTIARRTLRGGHLPAYAAVRVEEFVNFVDYDYPQPNQTEPLTVHVEGVPSPWRDGSHLLRIGVQGRRVGFDQRKPAHLTFLIDTSGSMQSDDKLGLVKRSLSMLVDELQDGDTVAIVAYAGSAGVVLEPTPVSQRREILGALDRLRSGGSTAMGAGIETAYALASRTLEPGAVNRVIVASDGDVNVGVTEPAALSALVAKHADRGITLTTLGFGTGNLRDHRMEQLANDGDGNYFYVDGEAEARRLFVDELPSTLEVIARDVKVQVAFHPEAVEQYRLVGYENRAVADHDFRNDAVDAGEIGSDHQVTALYEVVLAADPTGLLGTVSISSKAPGPEAPSVEQSWPMSQDVMRPSLREASGDTAVAIATASFAERLRGSPHVADVGYREMAAMVRWARRVEHPEDVELVGLMERAAELSGAP